MGNELTKRDVANEITTQAKVNTTGKVQTGVIDELFDKMTITDFVFENYQKYCGYNAYLSIDLSLRKEGLTWESPKVNVDSVRSAITTLALLGLDVAKNEAFVEVRNAKVGEKTWQKVIRVAPQGAGNMKLLRKYGVDVKKVYNTWVVREGDEFTYPMFKGIENTPPTYSPKSYVGKVLRVVVPVEKNDGYIEYAIAERESLASNLKAQIKNALQKSEKLTAAMDYIKDMTFEQMLDDKKLSSVISPSYRECFSREEMIITKLQNNAVKRIDKDFGDVFIQQAYEKTFDTDGLYDKKPQLTAGDIIERDINTEDEEDEEITFVQEPEKIKEPETLKEAVSEELPPEPLKTTTGITIEEWKAQQALKGTTGIKAETIIDKRDDRKSYFPPEVDKETGEVIEDDLPF